MATLAVARRTGVPTARAAGYPAVVALGYTHTHQNTRKANTTSTTHEKLSKKLLHKQVKTGAAEVSSHALALAVALGNRLVLELLARN